MVIRCAGRSIGLFVVDGKNILDMAKYGKKASEKVKQTLHEMHKGKLKSGKSEKKVTNPKQAIAIGLSEAREEGVKVPKENK